MLRIALVLGVLSLGAFGCAKSTPSGPSGVSSDRARAEAEADLAAGKATILTASGITRSPIAPDYDVDTGLPLRDTGCIFDQPYQDGYNGAVHEFIKKHGAPKNSLKARMLDIQAIDRALAGATELTASSPAKAPDGREVELTDGTFHIRGGSFTEHGVERNVGLLADEKVKVAFAANGSVVIALEGPPRDGFSGTTKLQIDPSCNCLLQTIR